MYKESYGYYVVGCILGFVLLVNIILYFVRKRNALKEDVLEGYDNALDGYYTKQKIIRIERALKILNCAGPIVFIYFGYWYIVDGYIEVGELILFVIIYLVLLNMKKKFMKQIENKSPESETR